MTSYQDAEAPPDHWTDNLHVGQIWQSIQLLTKSHKWTGERATMQKCPIFQANPSWKTLLVTDNHTAEQILNAPAEDIDRDDGFLNIDFDFERMLNNVRPSLMCANSGVHGITRKFWIRILDHRGIQSFHDVCRDVMRDGVPTLRGKTQLNLGDALAETSSHLLFKWILGIDGLDGSMVQNWNKNLAFTRGDNWITDLVVSQLQRKADDEAVETSMNILDIIRKSPLYGEYVQIAKEIGFPEESIAPNLAVGCLLNATGPCFSFGKPGIALLYTKADLRKQLAEEVRNIGNDVDKLMTLPLLDGFFYESARFFGKPSRAARKAVRDTTVTMRDGRLINIPKDSSVHVVNSQMRADPEVFADPEDFRPERFGTDMELRRRVFPFAGEKYKDEESGFYCPGARVGAAPLNWKVAVLPFLQDEGARIETEYVIDRDSTENGTNPGDLIWVASSHRQE